MSREYEDLGFPSCSLPLGRKTYLLAQGALWDLEFQCLDFLSLPSHQLNLVFFFKKKKRKRKFSLNEIWVVLFFLGFTRISLMRTQWRLIWGYVTTGLFKLNPDTGAFCTTTYRGLALCLCVSSVFVTLRVYHLPSAEVASPLGSGRRFAHMGHRTDVAGTPQGAQ